MLPSVVGITYTPTANQYNYMRKDFYARGRFWKFYSDGTNMVYRTSTDGETWSAPTIVRACTKGWSFSIWFDGTYLHYAYSVVRYDPLYYRRGEPEVGGTIGWSAAEQPVPIDFDNVYSPPTVCVDSDGYAWIGYMEYTGSDFFPYVIRSGNNDGTWGATPAGFPYQLSTLSTPNWQVLVTPLTEGKMLVMYYRGLKIRAQHWNGIDTWSSEVGTATSTVDIIVYSSVAENDEVHLIFKDYGKLIYTKWAYNSFSAETVLMTGLPYAYYVSAVICISGSDLYVFWDNIPMAGHIYYRKYDADKGQWLDGVDWIVDLLEQRGSLMCFYQQRYGYVGLSYLAGTTVKFNYFTTDPYEPDPGPPPEPGVPTPPSVLKPEPTKKIDTSITASGSRHVYKPSQGHRQRSKRGRINRHITWVPVSIVRA